MSVIRRRGVLVSVVLVLLLATAGTTFYFATRVVSPRQAAAIASPPVATRLTAPLEARVVSQSLIASGVVEVPSNPLDIAVPDIPNGIPVITQGPPPVGSQLSPGQELAAISAQPIFVLPGSIPAYRDLTTGDSGPDVTQLQLALHAAGFDLDSRGIVDDATVSAVRTLYKRSGVALPEAEGSSGSGALPSDDPTGAAPTSPAPDSGVVLPRTAFVFTTLPATVAATAGGVGGPGSALAMSVLAGAPQLRLDLEPEQAGTVNSGMQVTATIGSSDVTGVVSAVTVSDGAAGAAATATCVVRLTGGAVPQAGQTADATLILSATDGPVLAAPVSAVHRSPSGEAVIQVVAAGGAVRQVPVVVGAVGDGYVAVSATDPDTLEPGTMVSLQW